MTLLDKIAAHLRDAGYEEVEPGIWSTPDGDWTDKLIPAVVDCLERES